MYDVLNAYLENGLKIILHKIPEVKTNSGLSLEECAKLDYYYDQVCNGGTSV